MRAIIIGAGAAGVAAARVLGERALLLEAAPGPLAKLRISGGARCNLSNANLEPGRYAGCADYYAAVFGGVRGEELLRRAAGVKFAKIRDAQFFAASADEVARALLGVRGARVRYGVRVCGVCAGEGGWLVQTSAGEFAAEAVIVACGSRAGLRAEGGGAVGGASGGRKNGAMYNRNARANTSAWQMSDKQTKNNAQNFTNHYDFTQISAELGVEEDLCAANLAPHPHKFATSSDAALQIARQNGIRARDFSPALCELFLQPQQAAFAELAGLSLPCALEIAAPASAAGEARKSPHFERANGRVRIANELLFTHRGLGGPAGYQASLWWQKGALVADFSPATRLRSLRRSRSQLAAATGLPKRFCAVLLGICALPSKPLAAYSEGEFARLERALHGFDFAIAGRAPLARAEVATGGVDAAAALCKEGTFRADGSVARGLFFAGEAVDFTGALGGFNLAHALLSGERAGALASKILATGGAKSGDKSR